MYPELFSIGSFTISTFGLMLMIAFLTGSWITAVRMKEEGLDPELAWSLLVWVMLGGIIGSKLYFAIDVSIRTGGSFTALLFSRDGITWYGGLMMATLVGAIGARRYGVSVKTVMDCTAVAGAVGQAIGRIGCFLVGDDYGKVTDVPWAVTFPQGAPPVFDPVHPTQLYEVAWLLPVAGFLWWRRKRSPFLFGEYIALNGFGRFFIEMLRVNPVVLFGWTEPQIVGIGLIIAGAASWLYFRGRTEPVAA
jgi:phosphatidylglycerol:prolipoprotein diacylglycerol transferase